MNVKVVPLPHGVNGFVAESCGEYTVLLNLRCPFEQNQKTYLHELEHIENSDFQEAAVNEIELLRHQKGSV